MKVTTEWDIVIDTNIGQVDIDEFKQRVIVNPTIENAKKIKKSGLAKVVGFPLALVAPELVMACREAYQEKTRRIVDRDGKVLVNLSARSIGKTFYIPTFDPMKETMKEYAESTWKADPLRCKKLINQYWLKEKRGNANKVP